MKTINTTELTGAALDWTVAKCEGWDGLDIHDNGAIELERSDTGDCLWLKCFEPSTDWAQGGPIIAREKIGIWPSGSIEGMWAARPDCEVYPERLPPLYGPTPLIAAMRCYVSSKMGNAVEIPEGLS